MSGYSNSVSYSTSIPTFSAEFPVNQIASDLLTLQRNGPALSIASGPALTLNANYRSDIELALIRARNPLPINENELINVNGEQGIWLNKNESLNYRGPIPLTEFEINQDAAPEIINKKPTQQLEYIQELAIRYLRPPTPASPEPILIKQEPNVLTPPGPPVVIRQQPPRPVTPGPLIIREAPPPPPAPVGRKLITISGKRLPPPPRKFIVEKIAPLPAKPQAVLIERWLPYAETKRKVIFQAAPPDPVIPKPKNLIVQWDAPEVTVRREVKYLGVVRANPAEYVAQYGATIRQPIDLPDVVNEIKTPEGLVLAAHYKPSGIHELEGDLHALQLVDLNRAGLTHYAPYLQRSGAITASGSALIADSASYPATSAAISGSASYPATSAAISASASYPATSAAISASATASLPASFSAASGSYPASFPAASASFPAASSALSGSASLVASTPLSTASSTVSAVTSAAVSASASASLPLATSASFPATSANFTSTSAAVSDSYAGASGSFPASFVSTTNSFPASAAVSVA